MKLNAGLPKNPGSAPVGSQGTGQITVNLNRGLKGMAEGLIKRLPYGQSILDNGLREVIHRSIDENSEVPNTDFTAVELAERIGLLNKPRRRKR